MNLLQNKVNVEKLQKLLVPIVNDQCTKSNSRVKIDPSIQLCAGGDKGWYSYLNWVIYDIVSRIHDLTNLQKWGLQHVDKKKIGQMSWFQSEYFKGSSRICPLIKQTAD